MHLLETFLFMKYLYCKQKEAQRYLSLLEGLVKGEAPLSLLHPSSLSFSFNLPSMSPCILNFSLPPPKEP